METYTKNKLKKRIKEKGITLDDSKKKLFDKYSYYQVINAYKSLFITGIENIDEIKNNVCNGKELDRYTINYKINTTDNKNKILRDIAINICQKYGLTHENKETTNELIDKIRTIKYYNHLYSPKVYYSDFIRMYKFEHELRSILLRYVLILEENLKNIFINYLNSNNANDTFLTDIDQYQTDYKNITKSIKSIKLVFDKQTNKYSNPILRKNDQTINVPYWILINELTLGETIKLIMNLKSNTKNEIFSDCLVYFTNLDKNEINTNYINCMQQVLDTIGKFRNCLAHNQPIYNFNVKEFYSTHDGDLHYKLPKSENDDIGKQLLNSNMMSYFKDFFGFDKYNSRNRGININLSWIIYVIYKLINHIDKNNNLYSELTYVYKKYNIVLRPNNVSSDRLDIYNDLINKLKEYEQIDINTKDIIKKINNKRPIKRDLISLNKQINDIKKDLNSYIKLNENNNKYKYTPFQFENIYYKYTGINQNFFKKINNI